jgi:hypothetical protein
MKFTSLVAGVAAAVVLSITPVLAQTPAPNPGPIRLDASQIVPLAPGVDGAGTVTATFTNVGPVAAVDVLFGVMRDGNLVTAIHDKGKFSPKATITHIYSFLVYGKGFTLEVISVKLADGTEWDSPDAAQAFP